MARKIDQKVIIEINEKYLKIGTYAGVSRAMGGSPSPGTVKKYIIPNYKGQAEIVTLPFDRDKLPNEKDIPKIIENFIDRIEDRSLMLLSEKEMEEIEKLWEELLL